MVGAPEGDADDEGDNDSDGDKDGDRDGENDTDGNNDGDIDGDLDREGDSDRGDVAVARLELLFRVTPTAMPAAITEAVKTKPRILINRRRCNRFRSAADSSTTAWPSTRGTSSPSSTRLASGTKIVALSLASSFRRAVRRGGWTTGGSPSPVSGDASLSLPLPRMLFLLLLSSGPRTGKAPG